METKELFCTECSEETDHRYCGLMPTFFTQEEVENKWEKVAVCPNCGGINRLPVNQEEVQQAHERYVDTLVDMGVISEDNANEVLNSSNR